MNLFAIIILAGMIADNYRRSKNIERLITMTTEELAANINNAVTQLRKGTDEVLTKIKDLQTAVDANEVPQPVVDAVAALTTASQTLDDIVPDAPT